MPAKKLKFYICQNTEGLTRDEIENVREQLREQIDSAYGKDRWVEIPFYYDQMYNRHTNPLVAMSNSIKLLGDADRAYFQVSYGLDWRATVEHGICEHYKIPIYLIDL